MRLARSDCGVARACAGVVATSHLAQSAFGASQPRSIKNAYTCTCTYTRALAYALPRSRVLSRALAYGPTRAPCRVQYETRTGFVSNLYGFHFKPVRVSNRPHTGVSRESLGSLSGDPLETPLIRNAECGIRNGAGASSDTPPDGRAYSALRHHGITESRLLEIS